MFRIGSRLPWTGWPLVTGYLGNSFRGPPRLRVAWVRVLGWGLSIKDVAFHPLLFSERHGCRGLLIGRWHIKPLYPWPDVVMDFSDVQELVRLARL